MSKLLRTAFVASTLFATPVMAEPVYTPDSATLSSSDTGSSFNVTYDGFTGGGLIDGLTAGIMFTLTGVTPTSFTFDYAVANTSTAPITGSRVSGFGFNVDPTISGASSTGTFATVGKDANVPNIGTVDVCFKGGGGTNSCAGGGGGGVSLGDGPATGSLTLIFASPLDTITLSDFFTRYQSIAGAGGVTSAVGSGTVGTPGGTPAPVPEPSLMLLFGSGALALAFYRRRRASGVAFQPVAAY